jgi:hypothetical protein
VNLLVHGVTVRTQRGLVAVAIKKYRLRPTGPVLAPKAAQA